MLHESTSAPGTLRSPVREPRPRDGARPRPRWLTRPAGWGWRRVAGELMLVGLFCLIYEELRDHTVQAGTVAASHALSIVSAERALGLFHEQAVQAAFRGTQGVIDVFNLYYGGTHFLIPAAILVWLALRHPGRYALARTALAVTTGVAFLFFWLFPVAPPRLLPGRFGIIDTLNAVGTSGHFETRLITTAGDIYASMPSLHVGWAVWCALAVYPVVRHWALRCLVIAYPLATTLVVVATGNHFFLDAIAGAVLAVASWASVKWISRRGTAAVRPGMTWLESSGCRWWGWSGRRIVAWVPFRLTAVAVRRPARAPTRPTGPRWEQAPSTSSSTSGAPATGNWSSSTTRSPAPGSRWPASATPSCAGSRDTRCRGFPISCG